MERTEWYPAYIYPVRPGIYETLRNRTLVGEAGIHKLEWTGKLWKYIPGQRFYGCNACMSQHDGDMWRGLKEPHHV